MINNRAMLKKPGPLLLACNHPNSFLDAIILLTLFDHPVHSLARGDVFKKPFHIRLLSALRILPVYRSSEGAENLGINYQTFEDCKKIFRKKGIVLIFSEGICYNEWHLRPIKKGTARLAFSAWEENIPLEVLPVGVNYSSFRRFGKNLFINFGELISAGDIELTAADGRKNQQFTKLLEDRLHGLVFEIGKNDQEKQEKLLKKKSSLFEQILLAIPASIGWVLHAWIYLPIKNFTYKRTNENDHFDSVLVSLLFFIYPLVVLLITIAVFFITGNAFSFLLFIFFPLTAWAYTRVKPQLDK
jgi:1-acyl-sn-glycerol-3-phosphate acyltransferase